MEDFTFHIITPYKGPIHWLDECIHSVRMQTLSSVHHVIIDEESKGACRNHFETLQKISPYPNNIVIHLDGDDKLINHRCLEILRYVYSNNDVWATYGNYTSRQGSVCAPLNNLPFRESFKKIGWSWSHLRTFRASLIPNLLEEDMKDSSGKWFSSAPDVAIFLPILELCGKDRIRFINEDLVYYRIHQNNEHSNNSKLADQIRCAVELQNKKPYARLQ
jgi:hypothetical protein